MVTTPTPESKNSLLEPSGSLAISDPSDSQESTDPCVSTDSQESTPLVLGSRAVDEMLRQHRVPKGSAVYLDCHPDVAPYAVFFAVAKAALERGGRVVVVTVPPQNPGGDFRDPQYATLQSGRAIWTHLVFGLKLSGLNGYYNAKKPSAPTARLRFLPANSLAELNRVLDEFSNPNTSLRAPGAPSGKAKTDLILLYGLDYLCHPRLFINGGAVGEKEMTLLQQTQADLRAFLKRAQERCLQSAVPLIISRTHASYDKTWSEATLFTRTLPALFSKPCP